MSGAGNPDKTLDRSAFDEPIVAQNKSVFNAFFHDEISDDQFKVATKVNGVITNYTKNSDAATYASCVNGELVVKPGTHAGDITMIFSRTHPRFHPNRGKKISTSLFYDTKLTGDHEFGFVNFDDSTLVINDGITFQLLAGVAYANIYSLGVQKYHEIIPSEVLADLELDFAKGHLLDIQAQLRDVGDIFWFLSSKSLGRSKEVHKFAGLNNQDNITVSTPAMHACLIVRNNGVQSQLRCGCIDVSNESQDDSFQKPVVFNNSTDVANVGATPKVLIAVRVPFIYNNTLNTRDSQYYKATISTDKKANINIYRIRDQSILTKGSLAPLVNGDWTSKFGTSLQYIDNSSNLITDVNLTGLTPFDGTTISAASTVDREMPETTVIPLDLTHGEAIIIVGDAPAAAAAMNVQGLFMGEGI